MLITTLFRCCNFEHIGDISCIGLDFGGSWLNQDDEIAIGQCSGSYPFLLG